MITFQKGSAGDEVTQLQQLLNQRGYPVEINGEFGNETYNAVCAFQAMNLDQHGLPLKVDGKVGLLTWWSLHNPKPYIEQYSVISFTEMPPINAGGSSLGRSALEAAIGELKAGAGEVGGNNSGPWVRKYLEPAGLDEGNSWCASFVSWCFMQASGGNKDDMPFHYNSAARSLLSEIRKKGWAISPSDRYSPLPGDLVIWWRVALSSWEGHAGIVHQVKDGMLYTIEGNKSPKVQGFSYVFSRMERLLGYGHIPDI